VPHGSHEGWIKSSGCNGFGRLDRVWLLRCHRTHSLASASEL